MYSPNFHLSLLVFSCLTLVCLFDLLIVCFFVCLFVYLFVLASLNELKKWESALRDRKVWSELRERGSPSDLLVHLYFLKPEWVSKVNAVREHKGDKDAMEKLLEYIIQSSDPEWPTKLCEGLEECGQKLIAELFKKNYKESDRRPPVETDMQGTDTPGNGELAV